MTPSGVLCAKESPPVSAAALEEELELEVEPELELEEAEEEEDDGPAGAGSFERGWGWRRGERRGLAVMRRTQINREGEGWIGCHVIIAITITITVTSSWS
jgi:hypothetical protein